MVKFKISWKIDVLDTINIIVLCIHGRITLKTNLVHQQIYGDQRPSMFANEAEMLPSIGSWK